LKIIGDRVENEPALRNQAHWLVALVNPRPKPAKELACPITRTDRNNARNANTQYKTVGVQWFAGVWFPVQLFPTLDRYALRKPNRFILSNVVGN